MLTVQGMTCMGCVRSIKNVLTAIPGVTEVNVTLENGQVFIMYDSATASAEQFRMAIRDAGYEVSS